MNVLVLDPASTTGWVLFVIDPDTKSARMAQFGHYTAPDAPTEVLTLICIQKEIKRLIEVYQVDHIAIEDYFFSSKFANGSKLNVAIRTAIHLQASYSNVPFTIINVGVWKSFIAGRSKATKAEKLLYKAKANKMFIAKALEEKFEIKIPETTESVDAKGKIKLVKFKSDIVDAVCIGVFFLDVHMKIPWPNQKISFDVH